MRRSPLTPNTRSRVNCPGVALHGDARAPSRTASTRRSGRDGRLAQARGGGASACRADGDGQRGEVVGALVALAVDEEARRPRNAARVRAGDVLGDAVGMAVAVDVVPEAIAVEAELGGVAAQLQRRERVLVVEQ